MKNEIDIQNWARKEHFEFFSKFDEPFFGVTAKVDCTQAYKLAKSKKASFFLTYLHNALVAANKITNFKYRIVNDKVYQFDQINASPTINRHNGTFGFSYIEYREDFNAFVALANPIIEAVRNSSGLDPSLSGENVIHFSSLPWIDFTSLSHARHLRAPDSCPKISFGKMTQSNDLRSMPVSVHVHHALVDGIHVGQFFEEFQHQMNQLS